MSFGFVYCGKDDGRQGSGSRCRVVDCESFLSSFTNNGTGGICGQEDRPGCYGADAGGGIYEIRIGKTTLRVYSSSDYRRGSGIRGFRRTVEKNSDTMLRYIWNDRDGVSYRLEKVE